MRIMRWLAATAVGAIIGCAMSGCVRNAFRDSDCERRVLKGQPSMCAPGAPGDECRRIMAGVNVMVCADAAVGAYCRRGNREVAKPEPGKRAKFNTPIADNGRPVDYDPRACLDRRPMFFGRRPSLWIGRTFADCWLHELAHFLWPDDPAFVAAHFPCFGDRR